MMNYGHMHAIRCTITLVLGQFISHGRHRRGVGLASKSGHTMPQIISDGADDRACRRRYVIECLFALVVVFAEVEEADGFVDVAIQI